MDQEQLIRHNTLALCRPSAMRQIEKTVGKKKDLVQFHLYPMNLNKKSDYRPREVAQSVDTDI